MAYGKEVPYPVYWDVDGVLVRKHRSWNVPGRVSKALPRPMPKVHDSLDEVALSGDFRNAGIATSRDTLVRGRQTPRQLRSERHGHISMRLGDSWLYSAHNYERKIKQVLYNGSEINAHQAVVAKTLGAVALTAEHVSKVVLIDDSVEKVVQGVMDAQADPQAAQNMDHFAFVAFGREFDELAGLIGAMDLEHHGTTGVRTRRVSGTSVVMLPGAEYQIPVIPMQQHGTEEMRQVMDAVTTLPTVA